MILLVAGVVFLVVGTIQAYSLLTSISISSYGTVVQAPIHGKGTVRYLSFEGGFYGIVGDDGKNYDPINMPQEFRVDGLRVQFTANLTSYVSFHMWGYVVELLSIDRLP